MMGLAISRSVPATPFSWKILSKDEYVAEGWDPQDYSSYLSRKVVAIAKMKATVRRRR